MKTPNLSLDLFTPHQTNKEVLLNESLLTMDQLLTNSVQGLIREDDLAGLDVQDNVRYIITEGEHQHHIALYINITSGWQFIMPQNGMTLFIQNAHKWFYFKDSWHPVVEVGGIDFENANGDLLIAPDTSTKYYYLTDNTDIAFTPNHVDAFTLIIKQNDTALFDVNWHANILWNNGSPHITQTLNRIDVFRFIPLPETGHILAEIIGQNYQY